MAGAFHGTPISPNELIEHLGRRRYCVSYFRPDQITLLVTLALVLMIDNGAFSAWKKGLVLDAAYWRAFYDFVIRWLPQADPRSWFVIPDVIDAGTQEQDALIRECPAELLNRGAPVWHMDEPISRLLRLIEAHPRVCIGSTAEFAVVGSPAWRARMDEVWDEIIRTFGAVPIIHMLRGMQCFLPTFDYPFDSGDSTDIGRNHNRLKRYGERHMWAVARKADRWDELAARCPTTWTPRSERSFKLGWVA
ncbi:MAG: hypothetical protein DI570_16455 [Phenylobacterium zucineum]|nr:MAG: hypothetical protein DI570_16455 [Phenylobacterium zucineum]